MLKFIKGELCGFRTEYKRQVTDLEEQQNISDTCVFSNKSIKTLYAHNFTQLTFVDPRAVISILHTVVPCSFAEWVTNE